MRFIVDNQLPPALARLIHGEFGVEAVHVQDVGLQESSDAEVWDHASETNSILITKDEDFADMILRSPTAGLIWIRVGNCRRSVLLEIFRRTWPRIVERLRNNDLFIEVR